MSNTTSIGEQLVFCTTKIDAVNAEGILSSGTGFFFAFRLAENDRSVPLLVTNKHVVKDTVSGAFCLTKKIEKAPMIGDFSRISLEGENWRSLWREHPDPTVDLCALPVAPLLQACEKRDEYFHLRCLSDEHIPTQESLEDLATPENIIMIGYPLGLWDSKNNMPIIRRGITATHPAIDYQGRKEFLIDAACFGGSSGSPVVLYNSGSYSKKGGGIVLGNRFMLLGVLYGGPTQKVEGTFEIQEIPTSMSVIPVSRIPTNLGVVIKAERIMELKQLFC